MRTEHEMCSRLVKVARWKGVVKSLKRQDGYNGPPGPLGWRISGDSEPVSYFQLWGQGRRPRFSMRVFRGPGLAPQVDLLASKVISFRLWVRGVCIVLQGQERLLLSDL